MRFHKNNGFGIIEIIIGSALISISLFSLAAVSGAAFKVAENTTRKIQASFLLEEGMEAIRFLRDESWSLNIAPLNAATPYYLNFSAGKWQIISSPTPNIDGIFERTFIISNVYRNIDDDIVSSGGILDAGTKKITFSVSWSLRGATTTKNLSAYITNLFNN